MTEIRPIRGEESDAFLELLCEAFGLDYDRARTVFFADPLYDPRRKWALIEGQELISILTTVPLQFGWGKGIGIAGVATRERCQREGYAGRLLDRVVREHERSGEGIALLFAREPGLYAGHGFELLDHVVRGPFVSSFESAGDPLPDEEVRRRYDAWACDDPSRLRRDDRRWDYWRWSLRSGIPLGEGYFCQEGSIVREVVGARMAAFPVSPAVEWFGLRTLAEELELPLVSTVDELLFMGRGVPSVPRMFMTDQF